MFTADFYKPTTTDVWAGRVDGPEEDVQRWHQRIQLVDLTMAPLPKLADTQRGIVLLGFACDEGVRRNKGRVGAVQGPVALRKACAGFPVHFTAGTLLLDAGDIICKEQDLETAQAMLGKAVESILAAGYRPLLLGGGHEITYGHVRGIQDHLARVESGNELGLVNVDAHFDLRQPGTEGVSSGTGFWQLATEAKGGQQAFHYLAMGIQQHSNTRRLFDTAAAFGVTVLPADLFHYQEYGVLSEALNRFLSAVAYAYLTIDLDAFAAASVPGVSATAFNGIAPGGVFLRLYRELLQSGKVISIDIAELNPGLDVDNRTAKLGASLLYDAVMYWG
ncbi:formimidoylglutamase [Chitinophaga pendula]|uniref:formimidoylglutamase n=1 Tax=Chitinophaga TaxID=79328 RepID=UPI000BAF419D|nr:MULTISPECIES: formimidoylglutamase [Chitinophaga]ASZ11642.1 formimidoylglutamase [Chitinophaga sp. MD30]UCJ05346.1 formimidoylglutamase [Chitinophaga pendula]